MEIDFETTAIASGFFAILNCGPRLHDRGGVHAEMTLFGSPKRSWFSTQKRGSRPENPTGHPSVKPKEARR